MTVPALPPIDSKIRDAIYRAVETEPFACRMGIKLVALETGYSAVEMMYDPAAMNNLFARAHGGAIFALIDEAFETACQSQGEIAVALNVSVTYIASPVPETRLRAEARMISQTKKTAGFDIKVSGPNDALIATCQALAFRTGKPLPFL